MDTDKLLSFYVPIQYYNDIPEDIQNLLDAIPEEYPSEDEERRVLELVRPAIDPSVLGLTKLMEEIEPDEDGYKCAHMEMLLLYIARENAESWYYKEILRELLRHARCGLIHRSAEQQLVENWIEPKEQDPNIIKELLNDHRIQAYPFAQEHPMILRILEEWLMKNPSKKWLQVFRHQTPSLISLIAEIARRLVNKRLIIIIGYMEEDKDEFSDKIAKEIQEAQKWRDPELEARRKAQKIHDVKLFHDVHYDKNKENLKALQLNTPVSILRHSTAMQIPLQKPSNFMIVTEAQKFRLDDLFMLQCIFKPDHSLYLRNMIGEDINQEYPEDPESRVYLNRNASNEALRNGKMNSELIISQKKNMEENYESKMAHHLKSDQEDLKNVEERRRKNSESQQKRANKELQDRTQEEIEAQEHRFVPISKEEKEAVNKMIRDQTNVTSPGDTSRSNTNPSSPAQPIVITLEDISPATSPSQSVTLPRDTERPISPPPPSTQDATKQQEQDDDAFLDAPTSVPTPRREEIMETLALDIDAPLDEEIIPPRKSSSSRKSIRPRIDSHDEQELPEDHPQFVRRYNTRSRHSSNISQKTLSSENLLNIPPSESTEAAEKILAYAEGSMPTPEAAQFEEQMQATEAGQEIRSNPNLETPPDDTTPNLLDPILRRMDQIDAMRNAQQPGPSNPDTDNPNMDKPMTEKERKKMEKKKKRDKEKEDKKQKKKAKH